VFKIATIMHNSFHQRSPPYLKDLVVTLCVNDSQRRQLRSSCPRSALVCRTMLSRSAGGMFRTVSLLLYDSSTIMPHSDEHLRHIFLPTPAV